VIRPGKIGLALIDKKITAVFQQIRTVPAQLQGGGVNQRFEGRTHRPLGLDSPIEKPVFGSSGHPFYGSIFHNHSSALDQGKSFEGEERRMGVRRSTNTHPDPVSGLQLGKNLVLISGSGFAPEIILPFYQSPDHFS